MNFAYRKNPNDLVEQIVLLGYVHTFFDDSIYARVNSAIDSTLIESNFQPIESFWNVASEVSTHIESIKL